MDNVCHSFAGAAIAHCGWARRAPRATVLAIVAANIPDVDAFTYFFADAPTAVWFRRGWTHGLPALVAWALGLAALFGWIARRRGEPATWRTYLPLAFLAVASHPALDWLNTYGVRLLMPFSDRWFYGDTLFIVDLVLIGAFGAAWVAGDRVGARHHGRGVAFARGLVAVALAYVVAMRAMSVATRSAAARELGLADTGPRDLVVSPLPASVRHRTVLVRRDGHDEVYDATLVSRGPVLGPRVETTPTGVTPERMARAIGTRDGRKFLTWSRFPYFVPGNGADSGTLFVGDARYATGTTASWAGIRLRE